MDERAEVSEFGAFLVALFVTVLAVDADTRSWIGDQAAATPLRGAARAGGRDRLRGCA